MESVALHNLSSQPGQINPQPSHVLNPPQITSIIATPSPNRLVKRDLKGIHIIVCRISVTLLRQIA
jgi:hypothetical protein